MVANGALHPGGVGCHRRRFESSAFRFSPYHTENDDGTSRCRVPCLALPSHTEITIFSTSTTWRSGKTARFSAPPYWLRCFPSMPRRREAISGSTRREAPWRQPASFEVAAAILPSERSPWYNLGVACLQEGDRVGGFHLDRDRGDMRVVSPNDRWYVRSIEAFTKSLELEPGYTPALVMRGHARRNRLELDLARADWTAAQKLGDPHAAGLLARLDPLDAPGGTA